MDFYPQYKPLRNLLREFNLQGCLEDLWFYFQAIDTPGRNEGVWDGRRHVPLKQVLYKWDIALLAREIVLCASPLGRRRLRPWQHMARVVNLLRVVDDRMAQARLTPEEAYNTLSPTGHQQFQWQQPRPFNALMRYFKVFSAPEVERLLIAHTGAGARDWFFVGFATNALVIRAPSTTRAQSYTDFGVSQESSQTILEKLSQPVANLKEQIETLAVYDETWKYTWNPLESKPLVGLDPAQPELLHCPVPAYVLKRVSQGLFYEISQVRGYENPFGASFQAYVGEVLRATFPSPHFTIYEEREYKVGKDRKDGVDWVLTSETANLFIECKAKRMTVGAKSALDPAPIAQQVEYLVKAVVQLYKNIADALDGHTHWPSNSLPIFPLVITLEDWLLFGTSADLLEEGVRTRMHAQGLDPTWLDTMPYTVASCADFEDVSPVIEQVGIQEFLGLKHTLNQHRWMIRLFAQHNFPTVYQDRPRRNLFRSEWRRMLPEQVLPETLLGD